MKAPRSLLPVEEALARILSLGAVKQRSEIISLWEAQGRILSDDLTSKRTQPPFDASAMDGYAVRHEDLRTIPAHLTLIGESAAGHNFSGTVGEKQCVRIFTGAPLPQGADTVILQENVSRSYDNVIVEQAEPKGRHIRTAGLDFTAGEVLLKAGTQLQGRELGLAAAMDSATVSVSARPRVGILATGDELAFPGEASSIDQIICSNTFSVAALVRAAGGEAVNLGLARDNFTDLEAGLRRAMSENIDVLVTLGGASVGDHDLVQKALAAEGMQLSFWQVAMRPGKPLMHGRLGVMRILGLPGNPVASYVCAMLFLQPLIRALLGQSNHLDQTEEIAILGEALKPNDHRQDYLRATLQPGAPPIVTAFDIQDSSMLSTLAAAQCLIIRPPLAPAANKGDLCRIIRLAVR